MPPSSPTLPITAVVPALNEEAHIERAVAETTVALNERFADWEILLFDDGSTDRTGAIMDELARKDARLHVTHNGKPHNIGGVFKQGLARARGEYVLFIPGDGENPTAALRAPFASVGKADLVIPYATNSQVRGAVRASLSRAYTGILNTLFGLDLPYFNGTSIYRTEAVRAIRIESDSVAYLAEVLVKLIRRGHSYVTVPIEIHPPAGHRSRSVRLRNLAGTAAMVVRLTVERERAAPASEPG